ncbi:MAG: porin family protein [Bacteroidia bacterium]
MKIRNIVFTTLFALAFFSVTASAQSHKWQIGVEGGPGISSMRGDTFWDPYNPALAYYCGVAVQYNVSRHFSLKTGLALERKGTYAEFSMTDQFGRPAGKSKIHNNFYYSSIPLLGHLSFGNKFKFFINAGPYVAFLLNQVMVLKPWRHQPEMRVDRTENYKRLDLGIAGGIGVGTQLGELFFLSLEVRDNLGLYQIYGSEHFPKRTNAAYAIVGLAYQF